MTTLLAALRIAAASVQSCADELNRLDAVAGDGDLGVTMSRAADAIRPSLDDLADKPWHEVVRSIGLTIAREAPSTSGTLVASGLLKSASVAPSTAEADEVGVLAAAFAAAVEGIAARGGAAPGAKTMIDALVPAARAITEVAAHGGSVPEALSAAAREACDGAEATKEMRPHFGRAGWLAERSLGHEDGGARLVAIVLTAIAAGLNDG